MYILENILGTPNIKIKKSNYISIITDKTELSRKILESFYNYFSEKRLSSEEKVLIINYFTGEKEQTSSKYPIYIENSEIDFEIELGSKSILHQRILGYFKQKFPIEPVFLTLNTLMDNFFLEEVSEKFKSEFTIYSNYKIDFEFSSFSPNDLIKKINIKYKLDENEYNLNEISNFEKIKLKLSMYESQDLVKNREKIFIFYYPERLLTTYEIKKLKLFLRELITKSSTIILATNSKYLLGDSLEEINIIKNQKLLNFQKIDILKQKYLENYPKLEEWDFIEQRLVYLLKNNIFENLEDLRITNKLKNDIDEIFLKSYEDIFIAVFYLKEIGISYNLDITYDESCVFSNYIKKNF
ncbi:MAG: hypothetical protein ACRC7S_16310 [Cetobacterium sp.]